MHAHFHRYSRVSPERFLNEKCVSVLNKNNLAEVPAIMNNGSNTRPARSRWRRLLSVVAIVMVFALSMYTSFTVYSIVRSSVAQAANIPSFETLSQQVDLQSVQPVKDPAPRAEARLTQTDPAQSEQQQNPPLEELPEERINILLLGIDKRQIEMGPSRTDTMIVLSIDPKSGSVGMLSIPRDLWVPIPGYGENKINVAHFIGDWKKYPGGGPALAKKTVSYNFGFPVHYYVRLNFEGFRQVIDTIGGLDIEVPREINDSLYPDENFGYEPLHIPAGLIHMDGDLALKYARTRKTDSDFNRARRQQQVIIAVKDKVLQLNLLPSLLSKLPELSRTLSDVIDTDMPMDEVFQLARLAGAMDMDNIKTVIIGESMTIPHTTPDGIWVVLPIREQIRPVIDDLFWSPLPTVPPSQ